MLLWLLIAEKPLPPFWQFDVNGGGVFLCFAQFMLLCKIPERVSGIRRTIKTLARTSCCEAFCERWNKESICLSNIAINPNRMCTKITGKYYSKKFNVTSNINYLPSHSLFIPPLNISTHNGNPFQNKSFHGASSGSILVLNNPRNIDQPSIIRIFQIIFVFDDSTIMLDWFLVHL